MLCACSRQICVSFLFLVFLCFFYISAHFNCKINWCCGILLWNSFSICLIHNLNAICLWFFYYVKAYEKLCTFIADWDVTVNDINFHLFLIFQSGVNYDLRSFIFRCLWYISRLNQFDSIFVIVEQFIFNSSADEVPSPFFQPKSDRKSKRGKDKKKVGSKQNVKWNSIVQLGK